MLRRPLVILIVLLQLIACAASPPFDARGVDARTSVRQAVATPDVLRGRKILWAGVIVQGSNLQNSTQLEVLAYPLRHNQRPDTKAVPLGRFIVIWRGYLETLDYASGRALTVVGTLDGVRHGKVGAAEYFYPVVTEPRLHLWPVAATGGGSDPQLHMGVGVIFH